MAAPVDRNFEKLQSMTEEKSAETASPFAATVSSVESYARQAAGDAWDTDLSTPTPTTSAPYEAAVPKRRPSEDAFQRWGPL